MSEWIELTPRLMRRPAEEGMVTFALSIPPAGSAMVRMNLSRVIGEALGWSAKDKVKVALSRDGTRVRLAKAEEPADPTEHGGYTIGLRGTTLTVSIRLHWLAKAREGQRAAPVEHTLDGSALVITMPAWARPPRGAMAPLLGEPPPKPLSAEESIAAAEREGKDLLARGRSVREVSALLNEDMATVREWKRQVDAATEAKAAAA
jgi:hypothetical protein